MTTDNQHTSNVTEDQINLIDYWRVLLKRKLLIGIIVGAAIICSIIYRMILPEIYASTASIFPPQQEGSMSGIASQLSGGLGALAGGGIGCNHSCRPVACNIKE